MSWTKSRPVTFGGEPSYPEPGSSRGAVLLYGRSLNVSNVGFSGIRGNMDRLRITSPNILARIFVVLEAVKEVKSVYCSHPSGWVALLGPCLPLILE